MKQDLLKVIQDLLKLRASKIFKNQKNFRKETLIDDILEFLAEYRQVSEQLRQKLTQTADIELLKKYLKLAAKAGSLE